MIAVMIGGIELVGLLNEKLGLRDPLTGWVAGIDLENVGYIIVGTLVLVWIISTAYWRVRPGRRAVGPAQRRRQPRHCGTGAARLPGSAPKHEPAAG